MISFWLLDLTTPEYHCTTDVTPKERREDRFWVSSSRLSLVEVEGQGFRHMPKTRLWEGEVLARHLIRPVDEKQPICVLQFLQRKAAALGPSAPTSARLRSTC
jgi:hypothetical protein